MHIEVIDSIPLKNVIPNKSWRKYLGARKRGELNS
jgi:hypothetical protein